MVLFYLSPVFQLLLFNIINAPITPGIQPAQVNRETITIEPQPLSITAKGGNKTANNTLMQDIIL